MGIGLEHHRDEIERPKSFSEAAMEVLDWQKTEFSGDTFETSPTLGKKAIKDTFKGGEGNEDAPEKMIHILDFLATRMKVNDGGQLRSALDKIKERGQTSIIEFDKKGDPKEILRNLLGGAYDERIGRGGIGSKGQVYTMALFLYMNTSGDSESEMTETLAHLIAQYDDPSVSQYPIDIDGLGVEPYLASLCKTAIEKHGLHEAVRVRTKAILQEETLSESAAYEIGKGNMNRVVPSAEIHY
jgi:hypothetical protein